MSDSVDVIKLISDILDSMIETQKQATESSTRLTEEVEGSNRILERLEKHFSNGFRSEIKNHISDECKKSIELQRQTSLEIAETHRKLDKLLSTLQKPWFWIKFVGLITAAIAAIVGALVKLLVT